MLILPAMGRADEQVWELTDNPQYLFHVMIVYENGYDYEFVMILSNELRNEL
mgnify:CR=1 FL=1